MGAGYEASPFVKLAREVRPTSIAWIGVRMQPVAGPTARFVSAELAMESE